MRMSKLEINPEEIDRGPLIAIAVAAVAVVGIALVAVRKGGVTRERCPTVICRLGESGSLAPVPRAT